MTKEVNEISKDILIKELRELVEELKDEVERLKKNQAKWEQLGSDGLAYYYQGQKIQATYWHNRLCTLLGCGTIEWLPFDRKNCKDDEYD